MENLRPPVLSKRAEVDDDAAAASRKISGSGSGRAIYRHVSESQLVFNMCWQAATTQRDDLARGR